MTLTPARDRKRSHARPGAGARPAPWRQARAGRRAADPLTGGDVHATSPLIV
jgi:hypothetical protein